MTDTMHITCTRCGQAPATETSIWCEDCTLSSFEMVPSSPEVEAIMSQQEAFTAAVDDLVAIYRDFDRTRRPELKDRLKAFYDKLQVVGERIGISRVSLDHLWKG